MLKDILNLEGAQELSKNQQKAVNGGKKCQSIPEPYIEPLLVEAGIELCSVRCRPSFLGIGFGSWSDWEHNVPC